MKNIYLFKSIVIAAFFLISQGIFAQEVQRKIEKTFPISKTGNVTISNKYGKLTLIKWNQPEVKFDIVITSEASSKSKAQEQVDRVQVVFENSANAVSALTEISDNSSWLSNLFSTGSGSLRIDYTVHLPDDLNLVLGLKYGDLSMPNYNGKCVIDLKYGNLKSANFGGGLTIDMKYSDAIVGAVTNGLTSNVGYGKFKVTSANNAVVDLSYGEIVADRLDKLVIETKYSKIKSKNTGPVVISSKYDDIDFGSVGSITSDSKYTSISMDEIGGDGVFSMSYGNLNINKSTSNVKSIRLDSKYTHLVVGQGTPFKLVLDGDYTDVGLGSSFKASTDVKEGKNRKVNGYYMSNSGPVITATTSYGSVKVK